LLVSQPDDGECRESIRVSAQVTEHDVEPPRGLLDKLIYYLGAAGMLALFSVVLYGVGMRYLFNRPPLWSADVPNLMFIWLVFTVVGLTAKLGPQIRVVFFIERMPRRISRALAVVSHCAVLLMLAAFIVYSAPIIELSASQTMLSTGWPGSVYFYALPVGSVIMGYYQLVALLRILSGRDHADTWTS
jgi:TRAP-type C4-dicarboxylate transport system permease small subunit